MGDNEATGYTETELAALRRPPLNYRWDWMLDGGGSVKVDITGRWTAEQVAEVRTIFGLILNTIERAADD